MDLAERIKEKAFETGFDLVGITSAEPIDDEQIEIFNKWLRCGYSAQMSFMEKTINKRFCPAELLTRARSVIIAAINYKPSQQASKSSRDSHSGKVASYAQYEDYHVFIRSLLNELADFIASITNAGAQFRICVDSAPVAEKTLAVRAGLGFIGKNHLLINLAFGPQILLGEIITTMQLQPDKPLKADCGSCRKCIEACPTGALRQDGFFDAGRCISYLTIEHKQDIPRELADLMGNHIFGCDDCITACPFQQKAQTCKNKNFRYYPDRANLDLREILEMKEDVFKRRFADSPVLRPGLEQLKRNARICLENHGST